MIGRGVECLNTYLDKDGTPNFTFMCDCGTGTTIVLSGATEMNKPFEFAYTCDGCASSHWITIEKII